jgi:MYXO-CTERM domain-containing protein
MDAAEPPALIDVGPSARGGRTFAIVERALPETGARPETRYVLATPKAVWDPSKFPLTILLGLPRSRDLGADTDAEVAVALRSWSEVPCTAFRATLGGTTASAPGDDGTSGVYFRDDAWPAPLVPGALAQTLVRTDGNGFIYDADVHVNGKEYVWSLDGRAGTVDTRSVLTHELGHLLGLGHSLDPVATMWASKPAGLGWRSLEADDVAGVCFLYPGTGDPGCPSSACPAPFTCVAKRCERPGVGSTSTVCAPCERVAGACDAAGSDARCIDVVGGRVCGRACAVDAECGPGFHCKPTSEAGDLQCVSDDGCQTGPFPCGDGGACPPVGLATICSAGACLGALPPSDAGADAASDGGPDAGTPPVSPGGGCSCHATGDGPRGGTTGLLLAAVLALALRRRR